MKFRALIIFVVLLIATTVNAFDGKRKGFVLGGGIGFAPATHYKTVGTAVQNTSESVVLGASAGYGFDEKNLLMLDLNVAPHGVDDVPGLTLSQTFFGLSWYHYLRPEPSSILYGVGLGTVSLVSMNTRYQKTTGAKTETLWIFDGVGPGAKLEVGYQLSSLIRLSSEFWIGSFKREDSKRVNQYVFDITTALTLF